MGKYIDNNNFLPEPVINTLMGVNHFDQERIELEIEELESAAITIIEATINTKVLFSKENGTKLMTVLCKNYVTAKLYEQTTLETYVDLADLIMAEFRDTLKRIKEAQLDEKITSNETPKIRSLYFG